MRLLESLLGPPIDQWRSRTIGRKPTRAETPHTQLAAILGFFPTPPPQTTPIHVYSTYQTATRAYSTCARFH